MTAGGDPLSADAVLVLDAVLRALDGMSGQLPAFPIGLAAAAEVLLCSLLLEVPAPQRRETQAAMADALRQCAARVARANYAECRRARLLVRAVVDEGL